MKLTSKQTRHLRALAHHLNPVVMIGHHGLTEQVLHEIDSSLKAHELIKIKVFGDDRASRAELLETICQQTGATPIHHLGKQLVIYRAAARPKIILPQ